MERYDSKEIKSKPSISMEDSLSAWIMFFSTWGVQNKPSANSFYKTHLESNDNFNDKNLYQKWNFINEPIVFHKQAVLFLLVNLSVPSSKNFFSFIFEKILSLLLSQEVISALPLPNGMQLVLLCLTIQKNPT